MKRIVGVGASVLDTIIEMGSYPEEDIKIRADYVFTSGGGPVSNALVCIAKLGMDAEYFGLLSDDNNGHQLIDEFKKYHVKTTNVRLIKNTHAFTSYIVLSKSNGSRTCIFDKGTVPDDPSLLNLESIKNAGILHLDGNYLEIAKEAIKVARKNKILVSLDAGSVYPHITDILNDVDILIASEDFARKLTGENDIELAIKQIDDKYHPLVLIVTEGKKGGTYMKDMEVRHYHAFNISCLDSNGAGDTFHGAFLYAFLNEMPLEESIRFASAASAIKCQRVGVRQALPTKEEVDKFLKENH